MPQSVRLLLAATAAVAACLGGGPGIARVRGDQLPAPVAAARAEHAARLEQLAAWAEGQGLAAEAAATRAWAVGRDPRKLYLTLLCDPAAFRPLDDTLPAEGVAAGALDWRKRMTALRRAQAETAFGLAQKFVAEGRVAQGYELLMETLRENPDHEQARSLVGYRRFRSRWHTPYEIRRATTGHVWHAKFGWLKSEHVARYEAGERLLDRRWISASEDRQWRSEIRRGWVVETEHYEITTNHSLEAGVALGRRLERLYQAWQFAFPLYLTTPDKLAKQFESGGNLRAIRGDERHRVVYFRDRDEYVRTLARQQPNIGITTGIYFADPRTAYFFAGGEHSDTTLYHEATHQLFHETRSAPLDVGQKANFWFIEGIACYMESLAEADGHFTLGGAETIRFQNARHRLLEDGFYVPLEELCGFGMAQLQKDPRISPLYSQSSGLAHFLMHHDAGRYRDAVTNYLVAIYTVRDHAASLAEATGASFRDLDAQYRAFVAAAAK